MKVLVCGSREWADNKVIRARLRSLPDGAIVIHGGARGVDTLAHAVAEEYGLTPRVYKPRYGRYGRFAPLARNLQMLDENPDLVIAFWDGKSTGTGHTITEARKRGIPVEVIA